MGSIARRFCNIFKLPTPAISPELRRPFQIQQWRGIRVQVFNGNVEKALTILQRKMQSSGIERMIKREQLHHIKNSEKRVLARKKRKHEVQSQELARKLQSILMKKVRGL
ncbi:Ribosomal protein S21 family protein [Euphorbia peplus]|nr:Ribosomal protein S21 family protein [Euphorbia peplus]